MADMSASYGQYGEALGWLEELGADAALPAAYERKRVAWMHRARSVLDTTPRRRRRRASVEALHD
jgi:hypothetical protein